VQSSPYTPGAVPPSAQTSVKVAILLPLTGDKSAIGQSMLQAAQLAVFDSGYDNFELIPFDTHGNAQGASIAATSAAAQGAQIILGPLLAEEVRAAKPITAARSIPMLAFSTDWTLAGGNTFIMGFLPFGQVERVAAYAASRGLRRTAILSAQDTYARAAAASFEQSAQRHGIVATQTKSPGAGFDSVFIPATGTDLGQALSALPQAGLRKLGTGLWDEQRLAANPGMEGAWFAAPSPAARAGFEQRYRATYSAPPIRIATLAYDATALCTALAKHGAARGTGPAFDMQSLTNPAGFAGIDGIVRLHNNGLAERGLAVLEMRGGRIVEIDPAPNRF
jgi:ABC-type branched-subunit amino acid transport system substrate-binding protein